MKYDSRSQAQNNLTYENGERWASQLWETASSLAQSIDLLNKLAKKESSAIMNDTEAYECVVLSGEDIIYHLRSIAQRLDRAVCIKHQKED